MIAIGLTDLDWFTMLKSGLLRSVVNFWTPTPWNFSSLREGEHFYFLLKAPVRKIGGFGEFDHYEEITVSEAWDRFGTANGVSSLTALSERMRKYVGRRTDRDISNPDPVIGCIVLRQPFFFDDDMFFASEDRGAPVPRQVVKFKTFRDINTLLRDPAPGNTLEPFELVNPEGVQRRTGTTALRPHQQQFRHRVLEAYSGLCAITGESTVEVLQAAHIQPYIDKRSNDVRNGILLRSDLHALFDAGLISIDSRRCINVSPYLDSEEYRSLEGKQIRLPKSRENHPSLDALEFHRQRVFRGETEASQRP